VKSATNGVNFSNGKITSTASVGAQVDGGLYAHFSNVGFQNQSVSVVCTNTTTKVGVNNCTWNVPPYGTSNVKINGIPLPANSTAITLPAPTAAPPVILGGYQFDLSTVGVKALQYDITTISQRNSLYIFEADFEIVDTPTTWNWTFTVDKDVGGQLQVSLGSNYPFILNGTSGAAKRIRIPFFVNGAKYKTVLSIVMTPTLVTPGASVKLTNISLQEASNISMTDSQINAMLINGYNLDFYQVGQSLYTKGKNRKVIPVLDPTGAVPRTTLTPTAGAWEAGDEMIEYNPVAAGTMGRVCTTPGSQGTWKTYGAIAA